MKRILASAAALALATSVSHAQIIRLGPGSFTPLATVITFSEFAQGTINPTYNFNIPDLGGATTVSFAGAFVGQTVTGVNPRTLTGNPTGPLALNTTVQTRIVGDGANPTSPVLSGDPIFNGPISVLFSRDVGAVGLDGGFFDAIGGTSIRAFRRDGTTIGTVTNAALGIEFFGLASTSGEDIAGISFFITGNEPAGFAIDNLTFGSRRVVNVVPEPSTYALMATGLVGMAGVARRRRTRA